MIERQDEHEIPLCRRSSVMVDQLGRAEFALGAVQRLTNGHVPIGGSSSGFAFMFTQELLINVLRRMTLKALRKSLHFRFQEGRTLTRPIPVTASNGRRP